MEVLAKRIKWEKEIKEHKIVFVDDMINYVENLKV